MAWTDLSDVDPATWDSSYGSYVNSTGLSATHAIDVASVGVGVFAAVEINSLEASFNVPGFDDGYQPAGTKDPIMNNMNEFDLSVCPPGGGDPGASTRPSVGLLYPRN